MFLYLVAWMNLIKKLGSFPDILIFCYNQLDPYPLVHYLEFGICEGRDPYNFYEDLRDGEISLDDFNINYYHTGSLWMMGMKLDYDCDEFCISDIVMKLYEFEKSECEAGVACGVHPIVGIKKSGHITNSIIKEKAEEVTGQDLSPLFDLLELEY